MTIQHIPYNTLLSFNTSPNEQRDSGPLTLQCGGKTDKTQVFTLDPIHDKPSKPQNRLHEKCLSHLLLTFHITGGKHD